MIFVAMEQHGVVPNEIAYSALTSACEKGKQPDWPITVFAAMEQ